MQTGGLREYQRADVQFLTLICLEKRIWVFDLFLLVNQEYSHFRDKRSLL